MTDTYPEMGLQNFSCFDAQDQSCENFLLSIAVAITCLHFTELAVVENAEICRGNFNAI